MRRRLFGLFAIIVLGVGVYLWMQQSGPVQEGGPIEEKQLPTINVPSPGAGPGVKGDSKVGLPAQLAMAATAFPAAPFPGSVNWPPLLDIGKQNLVTLEVLQHHSPLLFLQMCLDRYDREIPGYRTTFVKQERLQGSLQPRETIDVHFRQKPFSVHFHWLEGTRLAKKVLYVEGQNDGQMKVRAAGLLAAVGLLSRPVDGPDAKRTGRYGIHQFGMRDGMQRTVDSMKKAAERGALHLKFHGIVAVKQLDDRPCYKFVRTPYVPYEEDNLNELTLYIDVETWLQVGSVLRDGQGQLVAEYFFRNVRVMPSFDPLQFTDKSL